MTDIEELLEHLYKENKITYEEYSAINARLRHLTLVIESNTQAFEEEIKEIAELKAHCKAVDEVNEKMKCCGNCINRGLNKDNFSFPCCDCKYWRKIKENDYWELEK